MGARAQARAHANEELLLRIRLLSRSRFSFHPPSGPFIYLFVYFTSLSRKRALFLKSRGAPFTTRARALYRRSMEEGKAIAIDVKWRPSRPLAAAAEAISQIRFFSVGRRRVCRSS